MADVFDFPSDSSESSSDTSGYTPDSSSQDTSYESSATPQQDTDQYFEVPNMGRVALSELTKGYLRQADYTRKTQQIAERNRQFDSWEQERNAYEQALGQLREFLQDRQRLSQYVAALGVPQGQQQPQLDPDEILTAARAQELLAQREQQLQQTFSGQLQSLRQQIVQENLETQYTEAVNTKLRGLGDQYPELRGIPGMEGLLREAVKSQNPTSLEQALSLFDQAAAYYMKTIDGLAQARVAKAQKTPLSRGIEPASTAAPAPRPDSAAQYNGVRDPRLRSQVMQDIMRIMSSGSQ